MRLRVEEAGAPTMRTGGCALSQHAYKRAGWEEATLKEGFCAHNTRARWRNAEHAAQRAHLESYALQYAPRMA